MCDDCDLMKYMKLIDDALDTGRAGSSVQFLESVKTWIEDNDHVTEAQMEAVDRIAERVGVA